MRRPVVAAALALPAAGCSLVLDFSDRAPADAPLAECGYLEPNETAAAAAPLAAGEAVSAAICADADRDFYRFALSARPSSLELRLSHAARTGDLDLRLWNADATIQLAAARGFGDDEILTCPGAAPACAPLAAGAYVVEVFPATQGARSTYRLALAVALP